MAKTKKVKEPVAVVVTEVKVTAPKKTDSSAKKKSKKKKVTKAVKVASVAPEVLHEPCGEGEGAAVDIQHLVKPQEKKITIPKTTYDDGLQINWNVHIGDAVHPFHSVRAMSVGLRNMGYNIGNTEKIRAFIRRRRIGSQGKANTYKIFDGIDNIYRAGTEDDLLKDRPKSDTAVESSSSDSEDEVTAMSTVV